MQALCAMSAHAFVGVTERNSHTSPIPNTAEIIIFLFSATLSFQTANTGSKSTEKSLAILIVDVAKMDA